MRDKKRKKKSWMETETRKKRIQMGMKKQVGWRNWMKMKVERLEVWKRVKRENVLKNEKSVSMKKNWKEGRGWNNQDPHFHHHHCRCLFHVFFLAPCVWLRPIHSPTVFLIHRSIS
jgi:hypothetical protein